MYYLLYEITNLVNGKTYIGQHITKNVNDGYMGSGKAIVRAIKKYGRENFIKEILLYAKNEVALNFFERALVTPEFIELDTNYNLKEGGGHGRHSKESIAKLSAAHKGKKLSAEHIAKREETKRRNGTNKPSLETIAKRSITRKGKRPSAETIAKIRETKRRNGPNKLSPETIARREETKRKNGTHKRSLETIAKISATLKGIKRSPRTPEHSAKIQESKRKNGTTLKGIKRSPEIFKKSWETRRKKQLLK